MRVILPGGRAIEFSRRGVNFNAEQRFNLGQLPQFLNDYYSYFGYGGAVYPLGLNQSALSWSKTEEISSSLPNYMQAIKRSPPAFAAQMVRASVMSQARLIWRNRADRHTFRDAGLRVFEKPWTNGTQGELLGRMEWHAGLAGNAYVYRQPGRLRVLRPDWVAIVYGSQSEPDDPKGALDGEVVGYLYQNGGFTQNNRNKPTVILPEELAHWTPLPDPMSPGLGMSWLTPALRDVQADTAALEHKLAYFSNGATPNLVIKASSLVPNVTPTQFAEWVDTMESKHKGSANAFKTLYLQPGADATVIGSNLAELDLTSITSHGETRVSYLSRVPAVILGIAAGLKGSSLNAGNYGEARRNFADSWFYSELMDACAALESIQPAPGGAQLWYDVADVPLLREDSLDAANIEKVKEETIVAYVNGGFTPDSAVQAVLAQDVNLLKHTGLVSVQLQPPGTMAPKPESPQPNGNGAMPDMPKPKEPAKASRDELPFALTVNNHFPDGFVQVRSETASPDVYVTVQPAQVTLEQPITVEASVPAQITNHFDAPALTLEAPITVEQPEITVNVPEPSTRAKKVTVKRNKDGSSTATIHEEG